jgi:hypothetical protein
MFRGSIILNGGGKKKEYKFHIKYVDDITGEIVERIDYDHSITAIVKHYDSISLNVVSIN